MLRSGVALVVASVPEGMVATTTHAIGVNALRQKDVVVRRLDAIETMAAVNVVCFDKTGTLTENRMSVAEAAREIADLFLHTEDLGRLAHAVEQGRTTHANIRKSLRFILSTNSSEVLLMLAAAAFGLGEGLTPMQLLWINVITDVLPGIGLALEGADPRALEQGPPSPDLPIIGDGEIAVLLSEGATLAGGALIAAAYGAHRFGANSPHMRSMTFSSLVGAQLQHVLACRTPGEYFFQRTDLQANPTLTKILIGAFALQVGAYAIPPLRRALDLASVGLSAAAISALSSVLPSLITLWRTSKPAQPALSQLLEVRT